MTAPERIWANPYYGMTGGSSGIWKLDNPLGRGTEYVRADLATSLARRDIAAEKLVEALSTIADRHIPDQPAACGGDERDWAVRQHTVLRSIARAALAAYEAAQ